MEKKQKYRVLVTCTACSKTYERSKYRLEQWTGLCRSCKCRQVGSLNKSDTPYRTLVVCKECGKEKLRVVTELVTWNGLCRSCNCKVINSTPEAKAISAAATSARLKGKKIPGGRPHKRKFGSEVLPDGQKHCTKCEQIKTVSKFGKQSHRIDGLNPWCKACISKAHKMVTICCQDCGAAMTIRETRLKSSKGYCNVCLWKYTHVHLISPRYRLIQRLEQSSAYRKWRRIVLKRDGNKCAFCGSSSRLEVDHIIAKTERLDLIFEPSNGRILCRPCHEKTPTYGNRSKHKVM